MSIKTKLFILCMGLLLIMYSSSQGQQLSRPAFLYIGIIIVILTMISIIKNKK